MKKTIVLIVFLFIAVIVVSGLYFSRLQESQNISKRHLAFIPANAFLVTTFKNDSTIYDLFEDYTGFTLLLGKEEMNDLGLLKEALLEKSLLADNGAPIYISFHPEADSIHWLLSMPLNDPAIKDLFISQYKSTIVNASDNLADAPYFELKIPAVNRKVYVSIQEDNALLSYSKTLIERAIDKNETQLSELFLEKFQENNHKNNSPFQVYVNHDRLKEALTAITKENPTVDLFTSLNGLSMLDLNYKSDVVMFSGISSIAATDSSYLTLFLSQQPVNHRLKDWIPDNVSQVLTFGVSDYSSFHNKIVQLLDARGELKQLREQIRFIESEVEITIDDELSMLWGEEFATLSLETGENIGLIAIRDSLEYALVAEKISTLSDDSTARQFDNSNLLYYAFGDPFKNFKRPYFTYANGYLIITNNKSTLSSYLDNINNRQLLILDEDYKLYDKLQSSSSNFSLFLHRKNSDKALRKNLKNQFLKNYQNQTNYGFQNFFAFSLQLSGNGDQFSVNILGKIADSENFGQE